MVTIRTLTPFSTAARHADSVLSWLGEYDQQRVASYQVHEDVYWGQLGLVKASADGDDPVQVPVARSVVEAVCRYLAVGWDVYVDPRYGTLEQQQAADQTFRRLFQRENVWAKFQAQKRWGLVKGDAVWHVTADPTKPAGSRLSVHVVDPATWFPVLADDTDDRVVGVYLAEPVEHLGKQVIRRQAYRKVPQPDGTSQVTSELALYELSGWDDRDGGDLKLVQVLAPPFVLEGVDQLPVYRVPNTVNPGDPYGSSLLRGLEGVLLGVDRTITDQDLAVSLTGLGVYANTGRSEVDGDGDVQVYPGMVVDVGLDAKGNPGTFTRVQGIGSVQPSLDHARYLEDSARKGASVPEVAFGLVDTTAAESGIALYLKLSPLLAANAEREDVMLGVYAQMLYDLQHQWLPAFEGVDLGDVLVTSSVGDPMPSNRADKVAEITGLAAANLITKEEAREELVKLGYQIPVSAAALLVQMSREAQMLDPYGQRLAGEGVAANAAVDDPTGAATTFAVAAAPTGASVVPAAAS